MKHIIPTIQSSTNLKHNKHQGTAKSNCSNRDKEKNLKISKRHNTYRRTNVDFFPRKHESNKQSNIFKVS